MKIGLFIVGDEILSGKRTDKHLSKVIELLAARGLQLRWARYLGDDRDQLAAAFRDSFSGADDAVFCCGGIGATPDDHTRQAAAAALGLPLQLHPRAAQWITERTLEQAAAGQANADMTAPENLRRLQMGEFPLGADVIPNPFNRIAGFKIRNHAFVPGFPVMAWPMIEWVLDTDYVRFHHRQARADRSLIVYETAESVITPLMEAVERDHAGIKAYSLPSVGEGGRRRHIELGVKGSPEQVEAAFAQLCVLVRALGAPFESGSTARDQAAGG